MVNRPAGGARSEKHEREPFDWYCDQEREIRQLMRQIDFGDDLIWDPSCGRGNILNVAREFGHDVFGTDIVDRWQHRDASIPFIQTDFLLWRKPPIPRRGGLSIINNPPYSYVSNIAENFIRHALQFPINQAAFTLPIAFLAGQDRWAFFMEELKPAYTAIFSQRPTMPPGSKFVKGKISGKGGMADYMTLIYRPPHRWRTETIWIKPD